MSRPGATTTLLQDKILTLLAPFFLPAAGPDLPTARSAVRTTLASYHPRSEDEFRLAALIVAFGFGALSALGKAAIPELAPNLALRLGDNAVALSRARHQNQTALDTLRKRGPAEHEPPAIEPLASAETEDLITFARSIIEARTTRSSHQAPHGHKYAAGPVQRLTIPHRSNPAC